MAFAVKTDYCGLGTVGFIVKDDTENVSYEKYQPQGQDGSFVATEIYGEDSAPTNNYALSANITATAGDITLNKVSTVNGKKYALESVTITTAAGSAPTVAATCQRIEDNASDDNQCHYQIPAFSLTTKQHAQDIFTSFSMTGDCTLTDCAAAIGGSINKDKIAGTTIASDINSGVITVTGTLLQTGNTAPTITPTNGWIVTQQPNCTNPETAYKSYTFELQKILAKN